MTLIPHMQIPTPSNVGKHAHYDLLLYIEHLRLHRRAHPHQTDVMRPWLNELYGAMLDVDQILNLSEKSVPREEVSKVLQDKVISPTEQFLRSEDDAGGTKIIGLNYLSLPTPGSDATKTQPPRVHRAQDLTPVTADQPNHAGPASLTDALLDTDAAWPDLRPLILQAEDTRFTPAQSEKVSPRLIALAEARCDSDNPQDAPVVYSAIRTGASMLRPEESDRLLPLVAPGHAIETSLVTVKMIGRIFEAQPPTTIDAFQAVVSEVDRILQPDALLNRYALAASPKSAAIALLAIYALAAMASTRLLAATTRVDQLGMGWFKRRATRKLRELRTIWNDVSDPGLDEPLKLLNQALDQLDGD